MQQDDLAPEISGRTHDIAVALSIVRVLVRSGGLAGTLAGAHERGDPYNSTQHCHRIGALGLAWCVLLAGASRMSNLSKAYGEENLKKLSAAYTAALSAVSSDITGGGVDRRIRIHVLRSLIGMAMQGDFDPDRLRDTALSLAERDCTDRQSCPE